MINHSEPWITESEILAAKRVLESVQLSRGEAIEMLETQLANYLGKRYSLFTGNGSQAQSLILAGLGVQKGDEVIVPSYVCNKVLTAVLAIGAVPVLCDIGEDWLMTPEETAKKINTKTRAIVIPHVYGLNAWVEDFRKFDVPIVEDICQSLGNLEPNSRTGTYSDFAFTSFHGTKCIAAGEGGMLFVNKEEVFSRIQKVKSKNPLFSSGTDIIASIALSVFGRYADLLQKRKAIRETYDRELPTSLNNSYASAINSMNYRYVLRSAKDFDEIRRAFFDLGIHVRKGVDNLIHREQGLPDRSFPNSVNCYNSSVSIPILPQMHESKTSHVCEVVNELFRKNIL